MVALAAWLGFGIVLAASGPLPPPPPGWELELSGALSARSESVSTSRGATHLSGFAPQHWRLSGQWFFGGGPFGLGLALESEAFRAEGLSPSGTRFELKPHGGRARLAFDARHRLGQRLVLSGSLGLVLGTVPLTYTDGQALLATHLGYLAPSLGIVLGWRFAPRWTLRPRIELLPLTLIAGQGALGPKSAIMRELRGGVSVAFRAARWGPVVISPFFDYTARLSSVGQAPSSAGLFFNRFGLGVRLTQAPPAAPVAASRPIPSEAPLPTVTVEPVAPVDPIAPVPMPKPRFASVRGRVVSARGKPLRALLTVRRARVRSHASAKGYFHFRIPSGTYTLEIRAKGFLTQVQRVVVAGGDQAIFYLVLSREAP